MSSFSCDEYNLYKSNKYFASIPISDQDSTATCYAFTATAILDTERFENKIANHKRTHPLFAAYVYHLKEYKLKSETLTGGEVRDTIRALVNSNICLETEGEKVIEKYKGQNCLSDAQFMGILEKIHAYFSPEESRKRQKENIRDKDFLGCRNKVKSTEQKILNNLLEELSIIPSQVIPSVIMDKILKQCIADSNFTPLVDPSKLKSRECKTCSDTDMKSHILRQLKRNKPVSISYCADVLYDKNSRMIVDNDYFKYSDNLRSNRVQKDCGAHASIVAGSRNKGGKCQMLLRNTWGDWKSSTWSDCLCETSKGVYEACKHGDTKNNSVGCWIDSDALVRNIYRTTHF